MIYISWSQHNLFLTQFKSNKFSHFFCCWVHNSRKGNPWLWDHFYWEATFLHPSWWSFNTDLTANSCDFFVLNTVFSCSWNQIRCKDRPACFCCHFCYDRQLSGCHTGFPVKAVPTEKGQPYFFSLTGIRHVKAHINCFSCRKKMAKYHQD